VLQPPATMQDQAAGVDTNTCSCQIGAVANMCSLLDERTEGVVVGTLAVPRRCADPGREGRRTPQVERAPGHVSSGSRPRSGVGTGEGAAHLHVGRVRHGDHAHEPGAGAGTGDFRVRLLLVAVATALVVALALPWGGAGERSLATSGPVRAGLGSSGQTSYIVQPGDTLWTIAQRLVPEGDPRPVESQLEAEVGGDTIVPGERLVLPRPGTRVDR
jgi:hypothetical protein